MRIRCQLTWGKGQGQGKTFFLILSSVCPCLQQFALSKHHSNDSECVRGCKDSSGSFFFLLENNCFTMLCWFPLYNNVHSSIIYNSQDIELTQMCINRRMDKEVVVYICNGILLSHKKNEILPFAATYMDLENVILKEVRERQISYDITYMWNLKKGYR